MKYLITLFTLLITLGMNAAELEESTIPVVDMQDYYNSETKEAFKEKLADAFHRVGFVAVINTGVNQTVIDNAYQGLREFFALQEDVKLKYVHPEINYQRGFVPMRKETAKNCSLGDLKEFYVVGSKLPPEKDAIYQYAKNVWPEETDLEQSLFTLYQELIAYSVPFLEAIAEVIDQPKNFLTNMIREGDNSLRSIHYPVPEKHVEKNTIWAAAHTDIDLIAIIPRATAKGLEVQDCCGNWIEVKVPEDAFIINSGDMLENLTNGYFRSSVHRVKAPSEELKEDRFSAVLFIHPRSNDDLSPLPSCIETTGGVQKFPQATREELLGERLTDINLASPEMKAFLAESGLVERMIDLGKASPDVARILADDNLASPKILEYLKELE